jgi:cell division septation protein DedD
MFDNAESFQQGGVDNHNLSNVLNNIRDDGPAAARRTSVADAMRRKSNSTAGAVEDDGVITDLSSTARQAAQRTQAATAVDETMFQPAPATHKKPSKLNWQTIPIILLLLITMVLMVMQYRADARVALLSEALEDKTQNFQQVATIPAADLQNSTEKMDIALAEINDRVKQLDDELAQIKSVQLFSEQSVAAAVKHQLQSQSSSRQDDLQSTNHSVAELRQALTAVKQDVITLRSPSAAKLKPNNSKNTDSRKPALAKAKTKAAKAVATDNWQVNLASLSDRNKARKAYQKLSAAGVSPLIQEVELQGKRMYRLSVDGFTSRKAAQQFVEKAARSYGFAAGWIRRIG